ncbi:hypothetical protein FIBSPDRAFT_178163 [Athelia psychrophila]|uniref:Uncharacterized protein n=1 Tax=Athelia psychrophila TaxID=1759441 RepID=A0A166SQ34_9AGAM|nr:hypothetical protein FIBSPDRAFT_178163 [Fibularhizoctonia sp. CBS 109695]
MSVCKEKPDRLPPLDNIGLEPVDQFSMSRGGSGRHRTTSMQMGPPGPRAGSIGLGIGSFAKPGGSFSISNFATPGGTPHAIRLLSSPCSLSVRDAIEEEWEATSRKDRVEEMILLQPSSRMETCKLANFRFPTGVLVFTDARPPTEPLKSQGPRYPHRPYRMFPVHLRGWMWRGMGRAGFAD